MIRIRFHARGGHGVKTASRIVGTAAFHQGLEVQDAPLYGAERRGAAVVAFTRIDTALIRERGVIDRPDLIVVGDETLLSDPGAAVLAGQESASAVFVNAVGDTADSLIERFGITARLVTFDISQRTRQVLGRASALSAGLAAAAARLCGEISERVLVEAVEQELGSALSAADVQANLVIAREVFSSLPEIATAGASALTDAPITDAVVYRVPYDGSFRASPSILAAGNAKLRNTGSWRLERPVMDSERCTRCGLCYAFCPDGAIAMNEQGYPIVDYDHCKGCMICLTSCPLGAFSSAKETAAW